MNIGIAGAGLIGRLMALRLLQKGWTVSLFDQDSRFANSNCSFAAAGMLAPHAELIDGEPLLTQLGILSMKLWPTILDTLNAPVFMQTAGTVVLAHPQDQAESDRFKTIFLKRNHDPNALQMIDRARLEALEPELPQSFQQGLFLPGEGQISPDQLLIALEKTLSAMKVKWHDEEKVQTLNDRTMTTAKNSYSFDKVIDCRGLGAKQDLPGLRGVRGEIIHLHAKEVNFTRPIRLLHPRYTIYIVPRPEHHYVVGATMLESEDFSPISVQSILELLSAAYSLHRGFAEARLLSALTQCRPAFPNNFPRIYCRKNYLALNGLFRHGYLLAPVLIEEAVSLLEYGPERLKFPELLYDG